MQDVLTVLRVSLPRFQCSLDALSTLHSLRELRASRNRLASVQGVHLLSRLTRLDVSHNELESLPSLTGTHSGLPGLGSSRTWMGECLVHDPLCVCFLVEWMHSSQPCALPWASFRVVV